MRASAPRCVRWLFNASAFALLLLASHEVVAQGGLGPEFQVNTNDSYSHGGGDVAWTAPGELLVVWNAFSSPFVQGEFEIRARRFDATGSPTASEFQVNTTTAAYVVGGSIAVGATGEAIVVWRKAYDITGQQLDIVGQRLAASGSLSGSEFVVSGHPDAERGPRVAMDGTGASMVVWQSDGSEGTDSDGDSIQARRFDSGGNPIGARFQVNTSTTSSQYAARVSMAADGSAVVVWADYYPTPFGRQSKAQRYDSSGNPVGSEFVPEAGANSTRPAVDHAPSGSFIIAWSHRPFSGDEHIRLQRYDAGGNPVGSPFEAQDDGNWQTQSFPDLAIDASGDLVVSWQTENEPDWSGFAQRFSSAGAPIGDDFQVYAYGCCRGLGPPGGPVIAVDANGGLAVTWSDSTASEFMVLGRLAAPLTLPSLGAVGLLGLAALALVAGVRSIHTSSRT